MAPISLENLTCVVDITKSECMRHIQCAYNISSHNEWNLPTLYSTISHSFLWWHFNL